MFTVNTLLPSLVSFEQFAIQQFDRSNLKHIELQERTLKLTDPQGDTDQGRDLNTVRQEENESLTSDPVNPPEPTERRGGNDGLELDKEVP